MVSTEKSASPAERRVTHGKYGALGWHKFRATRIVREPDSPMTRLFTA
jgi:hypothetical protein